MPENILILKSKSMILIVSLIGFFFSKTKSPKPAPDERPAIVEPNPIAPLRYSIVIATDTAQFGISPAIEAIIG